MFPPQQFGRASLAMAWVAAVLAALILLSGGFTLDAWTDLSFRDPVRPLLAAGLLFAVARATLGAGEFHRRMAQVAGEPRERPARAAAVVSVSVLIFTIAWNTRAAGGSDSSCYALQAQAFAQGRATLERPDYAAVPGVTPAMIAPGGFVPSPRPPHDAVPICAAGLSLIMTPAVVAAPGAMFLVVPLFAALAVWGTFALGRALDDEVSGAWAAGLLACSPIFLYQAVQPMSDVPAAALWLAAFVLALRAGRPGAAIGAGLCASLTVLMRPNMIVLALPLLVLLPRRAWLRFAAASLPAAVILVSLNAARYGSPAASGYGSTGALFAWSHVWPNLARYPRWLIETHTPLLLLAAGAPWLLWRSGQRRVGLAGAAAVAVTFATYLAYTVFDDWWYIRFLLPVIPLLLLSAVSVVRRLLPPVASMLVLAIVAGLYLDIAQHRRAFALQQIEARFRITGAYTARALPANAVLISAQQSGAVRFHGGRSSLTWDAIPADGLDALVTALGRAGWTPYFVLEDAEEAPFRERFAGQRFGGLAWPPHAVVRGAVRVQVYAADGLAAYERGASITPEIVLSK